jgi:hypothetical protein
VPVQDDVEVIEDKPMRIDAFAAYFSDGVDSEEQRPIIYSEDLGVAIEQLKVSVPVDRHLTLEISARLHHLRFVEHSR